MTQLELFKKTVKHEYTGKFLFYAEFIYDLLKRYEDYEKLDIAKITEKYSMFCPCGIQVSNIGMPEKCEYEKYFVDYDIPENAWINGLGVLEIPGSIYHFTRYISPLRNIDTLEKIKEFPFFSFENINTDGMKETADLAHSQGRVVSSWIGHMYEEAWQVRGYEEFLMDMITNPEICEYILDKYMEMNYASAVAAAAAGADILMSGDDVANQRALMFSVDTWRKFQKPRWKNVYDAARAINPNIEIKYHSDGNILDIIPDLIEIGVTILNPVQPECMDVAKLKAEFGKDLVFDGVIGTQSTMPFGSTDDVKNMIRQAKETCGYDGALIISPTHVLEPDVPLENIHAFFETCCEE